MNIGILGSGMVGQAFASKLGALGQQVFLGTAHPEKLGDWLAQNPGIQIGSFTEAAAQGEMLFNALKGDAALAVLTEAGAQNLGDKILVDISNPLDFSQGMPPSLFVSNTDSLSEQIQRTFPDLKVVKTFNTLNAALMVDPRKLADGDHTLFMSGNDSEAKARLAALFTEWFGWRDILDVGDITTARGTEALLLLWLSLFVKFGHPNFQFKIVR